MATIIGHGLAAGTLGWLGTKNRPSSRLLAAMILASILPDADVIAFRLHVPYEDMFGHRGFSHSIVFALLTGIIFGGILYRLEGQRRLDIYRYGLLCFLATFSHGLLDAMTNGGHGVAFFAPFSNERYFLPWQPIQVSPIGRRFFSQQGAYVLLSELLWIGVPCSLLLIGRWWKNRRG